MKHLKLLNNMKNINFNNSLDLFDKNKIKLNK